LQNIRNEVKKVSAQFYSRKHLENQYDNPGAFFTAGDFPGEFTESQYTKKLRGGLQRQEQTLHK